MAYKIIEDYLTPNKYSRPQMKHRGIKGLVIHWVANPGTSAKGNRDFFESRKGGAKSYGSAHEIVDLDGDIIICIPKNELAYHVGSSAPYKAGTTQIYTPAAWERLNTNLPRNVKPYPNNCTYGIEATHMDWDGQMTDLTYNTLVERCADLCKEFSLDPIMDIWTHQEVVGWKDCHRWFVNNPAEWKRFKQRVQTKMMEGKTLIKYNPQVVKERVYLKNGILERCDGDYSIKATDVRWIQFDKSRIRTRLVYEKGAKVSELVAKHGADFGINAPFFDLKTGVLYGDVIIDGDRYPNSGGYGRMSKWHEFGKRKDGHLEMNIRLNEDDEWEWLCQAALGLVEGGKLCYEYYRKLQEVSADVANAQDTVRAQRMAIGLDKEGHLIVAASDGRTPWDQGFNMKESAMYMIDKGCVTAVWFDGGGSVSLADQSGNLNQNKGKDERVTHHALLVFLDDEEEQSKVPPTPSGPSTDHTRIIHELERIKKQFVAEIDELKGDLK